MYKKFILTTLILIIYLITCYFIYIKLQTKIKTIAPPITEYKIEPNEAVGTLIINKLNINNNLYPIDNIHNNIEENITILKETIEPDKDNSIIFLAAHSGTGKTAFFKNLDKLNKGDEITLIYKDKTYNYIINSIWEENKTGYIHINKEDKKQLILTTCSPTKNNKQLVINSILKGAN